MAHLRQMRRFIAASLFFGAAVPGYSGTVTNTQDSGAGSLRDAINAFNAGGPSGSSIIFSIPATDPGCTSADHCTINVASPLVVTGHGDLQIGGSAQHIVLSWSGSAGMGAMLSPTSSVRLTLESLTLENASGGAIHVTGSVYIWNSTFVNNSACSGGAIYLEDFGFLYMVNDTFAGNVASGTGSCAHPGSGGALFVNQGQGQTTVFVAHATFADNFAASGGAVLGASSYGSGLHVDFLNSILAKSVGGNCAAGVRLDGAGGSLDDDGSCAFNPSGNVNRWDIRASSTSSTNGCTLSTGGIFAASAASST